MYNLSETRLVQYRSVTSAADANTVDCPSPPAGKIWNVIAFGYTPSVAESQTINIQKEVATIGTFSLINPVALALAATIPATFIEQGMEYYLLPGEIIRTTRQNHTAGSTMSVFLEFIEIDQPLYHYEEPQVVLKNAKILSSIRQKLGGGSGGSTRPGASPGTIPRGGGAGRPPAV